MRRAGAILLAILVLWPGPEPGAGPAEQVVASLSQNQIAITTNFDGSELLIFGAVQREAPIPDAAAPLEVIITVQGPQRPVIVRRKARRLGIWVNTDAIQVDAAPTFYAVSTTGPFTRVISATNDLRHRVSIPRALRAVDAGVADQANFTRALVRIRKGMGLYQLNEGQVRLQDATLFDTAVRLPANLVEGDYIIRIFLTREREVVAEFNTQIPVRKVGLERLLYTLAHERPLIYGLLSLAIAIAAGGIASAMFRYLVRS
ncbi:MAG: TIGR02186 family protein [Rhodobacteraceae bacterium]|nr:TIGR02186 family protein [Paracoccaceae bacterium]